MNGETWNDKPNIFFFSKKFCALFLYIFIIKISSLLTFYCCCIFYLIVELICLGSFGPIKTANKCIKNIQKITFPSIKWKRARTRTLALSIRTEFCIFFFGEGWQSHFHGICFGCFYYYFQTRRKYLKFKLWNAWPCMWVFVWQCGSKWGS